MEKVPCLRSHRELMCWVLLEVEDMLLPGHEEGYSRLIGHIRSVEKALFEVECEGPWPPCLGLKSQVSWPPEPYSNLERFILSLFLLYPQLCLSPISQGQDHHPLSTRQTCLADLGLAGSALNLKPCPELSYSDMPG